MVDSKTKENRIVLVITIVLIFGVLIYISDGDELMKVTRLSDSEKSVGVEQAFSYIGSATSQTFFNSGIMDSILIQSTMPVTGEDNNLAVLEAVVTNHNKDENQQLMSVIVFKNDKPIIQKTFVSINLQPGESYTYKTDEIDLEANEAQKNFIKMVFISKTESGIQAQQEFKYNYYTLTQCVSDAQCEAPASTCDVGNLARFSTSTNKNYCVKPCISNTDCYAEQVCIKGRCGY